MNPLRTAAACLFLAPAFVILSGSGVLTLPAESPTPPQERPRDPVRGVYIRPAPGTTTIAGRRAEVTAFLYNDFTPTFEPRPFAGNLSIGVRALDARATPLNISRATAEIVQGRQRVRVELSEVGRGSDSAILVFDPRSSGFRSPAFRAFPVGTKVTINLTFRVGNRDHRVTLRNVDVGAAY